MGKRMIVRESGDIAIEENAAEEQARRDAENTKSIAEDEAFRLDTDRRQAIRASTYVEDWDTRIRGKTFAEIKTLYDGATQQQKSDLLFYLLLVRALEVKG